MSERFFRITRRKFLASTAALALTGSGNAENPALPFVRPPHPDTRDRKPLAVLTTVLRPMSHSQHIAGRFMSGYVLQGTLPVREHYRHTLYVDPKPANDL